MTHRIAAPRRRAGPGAVRAGAAVVAALALVAVLATPAVASQAGSTADSDGGAGSADQATEQANDQVTGEAPQPAEPAADTPAATGQPETEGSPSGAEAETPSGGSDADQTDPSADPADPMSNEAPGEEAPGADLVVPPKETYDGQPAFEVAEILWSSVAAAERKLEDGRQARRDAIVEVRTLRKRRKELAVEQGRLGDEEVAAMAELEHATDRMERRAVFGYQRFGSGSEPGIALPPDVADYEQVVDIQRRSKMIGAALDVDGDELGRLDRLRQELGSGAASILTRLRLVTDYQAEAEAGVAELDAEIEQAAIEFEAFRAGSEVFIDGVVFPIAGPYSTPLVDSFGFPRMVGTEDEHWHEGIDLFAARGTPLVATERGVIFKLGTGRLGGLKFWLKGESGSEWYYAHLDSFAPGLADGAVVEAGQLLGHVGDSGNAVGTPPHLHMQLHPDGGRPVNPYPLLKVVSDLQLAAQQGG